MIKISKVNSTVRTNVRAKCDFLIYKLGAAMHFFEVVRNTTAEKCI